jgi:hypothetical protein
MPLNRISGLAKYYQLKRKITHGNAADQLHASRWYKADLFITCDEAFHGVLTDIATQHYPEKPIPMLADRSAASLAGQLEAFITKSSAMNRTQQPRSYLCLKNGPGRRRSAGTILLNIGS